MGCVIKYKGQSIPEEQFLQYLNKQIAINRLFESDSSLANQVYKALGYGTSIIQDNKSYYRGQIEKPTIDKNGNLVLHAKEDELYKKAGLKSKGVSMTDDLQSAIEYGNGQLDVSKNLASEENVGVDLERELDRLDENGYYLIQIPKNISNEIVKEAGEVKVIGDKIVIPKGQYKIEQIIDGVDTEITSQQKQEAQQLYSQYLDTIFPDSKVKDIVYHGTIFDFPSFSKKKLGKYTQALSASIGFFFTNNKLVSDSYIKPERIKEQEWIYNQNKEFVERYGKLTDISKVDNAIKELKELLEFQNNNIYNLKPNTPEYYSDSEYVIFKESKDAKFNSYREEIGWKELEPQKTYRKFYDYESNSYKFEEVSGEKLKILVDKLYKSPTKKDYKFKKNYLESSLSWMEYIKDLYEQGEDLPNLPIKFQWEIAENESYSNKELLNTYIINKYAEIGKTSYRKPSPITKNVILNLENPLIFDYEGEKYRSVSYYDKLKEANSKGNDGAILQNTYDSGFLKEDEYEADVFVVFEPEQIHILGSKQDIEGFKSWVDSNQSNVQYQKQIDLQVEQDSVLKEFANSLSERFNIYFDLISEEEAKSISPEYTNEPAFFDPKTKKAYLVKGKANKTSAIHEIFTHPFLLQIEKTNPTLYKNLLKEAKNNKSVVDYVDNLYGTNQNNDHEYIARAIDLAVQGELNQQKDKTLLERIQDFFNQLYDYLKKLFNIPEVFSSAISPNITLQQLAQFAMYGKGKMNLNPAQENIEYSLKATNVIVKNLKKINQLEKNKSISEDVLWNKIQGLGVPKEQLELIKNSEGNTVEEKLLDFANQYGYTIEINTAKTNEEKQVKQFGDNEEFTFAGSIYEYKNNEYLKDGDVIDLIEYETAKNDAFTNPNTSHYSNLTVPGGTNYTENEIATPAITPSIKGHAQFSTDNGIGWFRSDEQVGEKEEIWEDIDDWAGKRRDFKELKLHGSKTRRVLELQSDLFQKGRDNIDLVGSKNGGSRLEDFYNEEGLAYDSYEDYKNDIIKDSRNQFLQLLNKNNNWVNFFVKSIIQDSAKKGYEKVLFPKGDTAAKIEGHQTLEEFKKQKKKAISETNEKIKGYDEIINKPLTDVDDAFGTPEIDTAKKQKASALAYVKTLEKELADVESGQTQLSSIAKFYEETITNILKKQGYNPVEITDEYGNTWNEVTIDENRDNQNIVFQKTPQELLYKLNDIFEDRTSLIFNINNNKDFDTNSRLKAIRSLIDNKEVNYNNHLEHLEEYLELFEHLPAIHNLINKYGSKQAILEVYDNDNGSGNNNLQQEFIEAVNGLKSIFRNVNKTKLNSLENWLDKNIVDINKIDIQDKDDNVLYPTEQYSLDVNNEKFIKYYYELSGKKEDIITFAKRLKSTIATYKLLGYNNDKILEMLKCL